MALLTLASAFTVMVLFAVWLWATLAVVAHFRPFDPKQTMPRVHLVDFLALVAFLQLPLWVSMAGLRSSGASQEIAWGAGFGLVLFAIAIWWQGVSLLSQRGITHSARRFVLLGIALPLYLAATILSAGVALTSLNVIAFPQWWFPTAGGLILMLSAIPPTMRWISATPDGDRPD